MFDQYVKDMLTRTDNNLDKEKLRAQAPAVFNELLRYLKLKRNTSTAVGPCSKSRCGMLSYYVRRYTCRGACRRSQPSSFTTTQPCILRGPRRGSWHTAQRSSCTPKRIIKSPRAIFGQDQRRVMLQSPKAWHRGVPCRLWRETRSANCELKDTNSPQSRSQP